VGLRYPFRSLSSSGTATIKFRFSEVDSFKSSSEMKSCLLSEVDFLQFYAQNERNLSESSVAEMVRGIRFKTPFKFSEFYLKYNF
jgi:hypothetical protein